MLKVSGLCYKDILSDISFEIPDGAFALVAGPNGSGKSCLLKCIKGLYKHQGTVECDREIGIVFQDADAQILGATVEKDLSFGLRNRKLPKDEIEKRTRAAANRFRLSDLLSRRPYYLSGGEKRRLAIAGVMVTEPGVLLLDEPFANLDYPGVKDVISALLELKESGITIVLVSHEVEKVMAYADYTIVLDHGKTIAAGPTSDVFSAVDWEKAGIKITGRPEDMKWL